jgi:hypothetical protein
MMLHCLAQHRLTHRMLASGRDAPAASAMGRRRRNCHCTWRNHDARHRADELEAEFP